MAALPTPAHLCRVLPADSPLTHRGGTSKESPVPSMSSESNDNKADILLSPSSPPGDEQLGDHTKVIWKMTEKPRTRRHYPARGVENILQLCKTFALIIVIAYLATILVNRILDGATVSELRNETQFLLSLVRAISAASALPLPLNSSETGS